MSCCESVPEFKFALAEGLGDKFLPKRSFETDTGWDVCCAEPKGVELFPFEYAKIRLGFKIFTPPGWWVSLHPRSSTHAKLHLNCLYGVIDESWEGECCLSAQWLPPDPSNRDDDYYPSLKIEFGQKIGQIIPIRRQEMIVKRISNKEFDALCEERGGKRGAGGFGSSGD